MHTNHISRRGVLAALLIVGSLSALIAADAPSAPKLVVTVATWGDLPDGKSLDVTQKLVALVKSNSLSVKADRTLLGDPASGATNKLKVGYTLDGIYKSKTVTEGEVLDISTRLQIVKAVYGDLPSGSQSDVTEQVADAVRANTLSLQATNELFGDPAQGTPKRLRIDYTYDGVGGSVTVGENETAKLPVK